jgi:hypothetical protein
MWKDVFSTIFQIQFSLSVKLVKPRTPPMESSIYEARCSFKSPEATSQSESIKRTIENLEASIP